MMRAPPGRSPLVAVAIRKTASAFYSLESLVQHLVSRADSHVSMPRPKGTVEKGAQRGV